MFCVCANMFVFLCENYLCVCLRVCILVRNCPPSHALPHPRCDCQWMLSIHPSLVPDDHTHVSDWSEMKTSACASVCPSEQASKSVSPSLCSAMWRRLQCHGHSHPTSAHPTPPHPNSQTKFVLRCIGRLIEKVHDVASINMQTRFGFSLPAHPPSHPPHGLLQGSLLLLQSFRPFGPVASASPCGSSTSDNKVLPPPMWRCHHVNKF